MLTVANIAAALGGEARGDTAFVPTPGHSAEDRGTTIRLEPAAPDGVLVHSFNGGDPLAIKDDLRRRGLLPAREHKNGKTDAWRGTGTYPFQDETGAVLYRTRRLERAGAPKRFTVERPDGRRGWINGIGNVPRVLYRLPQLLAADPSEPIYFVEGERKADKLAGWGLTATAIAFGCKGWQPAYAKPLAGRTVIILPDKDEPGWEFAAKVAEAINGVGKAVLIDLPNLPPAGDVIDWAGTADELRALTKAALSEQRPLLPLLDISKWQGDPPPRRSIWGTMLPLLQTTMLTGTGGVGKSLFAQVLLTHVVLGRQFLGLEVEQGNALYITCEDDEAEIWRRQAAICAGMGVPIEAVLGKLFICSLAGESKTALGTFDDSGRIRPTDRWHQIEATCETHSIGLFAFDNATDAMAGDLNDIHQVAEFVNLLTGLAIERDGVALIIHHPNKAGDEWLGSVAWHNKVRSRLTIDRADKEGDPDARIIRNPKSNYGQQDGSIAFRWHRGTFVREGDLPPDYAAEMQQTIKCSNENGTFLACLRQRAAEGDGRAVGPSPGPNYAPTQFEGMLQAKGLKKEALKRAMDRLFALGLIESVEVANRKSGRVAYVIREVPESSHNAQHNARTTPSPNAAHLPAQRGTTHTIDTTYLKGAAHGPAAPFAGEA